VRETKLKLKQKRNSFVKGFAKRKRDLRRLAQQPRAWEGAEPNTTKDNSQANKQEDD
jgi:hypothetical protein